MLMPTGRPRHYGHLLQVLKRISSTSDFIHRSGEDNPRGQYFDVNKNLLSLGSFATSFKTISMKSDII